MGDVYDFYHTLYVEGSIEFKIILGSLLQFHNPEQEVDLTNIFKTVNAEAIALELQAAEAQILCPSVLLKSLALSRRIGYLPHNGATYIICLDGTRVELVGANTVSLLSRLNEYELYILISMYRLLPNPDAQEHPAHMDSDLHRVLFMITLHDQTPGGIALANRGAYLAINPRRLTVLQLSFWRNGEHHPTQPEVIYRQAREFDHERSLGTRNLFPAESPARRVAAHFSKAIHILLHTHTSELHIQLQASLALYGRAAMGAPECLITWVKDTDRILRAFNEQEGLLHPLVIETSRRMAFLFLKQNLNMLPSGFLDWDDNLLFLHEVMEGGNPAEIFEGKYKTEGPQVAVVIQSTLAVWKDLTLISQITQGFEIGTFASFIPEIHVSEDVFPDYSEFENPIKYYAAVIEAVADYLLQEHYREVLRLTFFFVTINRILHENPLSKIRATTIIPEVTIELAPELQNKMTQIRQTAATEEGSKFVEPRHVVADGIIVYNKAKEIVATITALNRTQILSTLNQEAERSGEKVKIGVLEIKFITSLKTGLFPHKAIRSKDREQINMILASIRAHYPHLEVVDCVVNYNAPFGSTLVWIEVDPETGLLVE